MTAAFHLKQRMENLHTQSLGNLSPITKRRPSRGSHGAPGKSENDLSGAPHRSLLQIAFTGSKGSFVALDPLSSSTSNLSWSGGMAHMKMLGRDHYIPSKPSQLAMGGAGAGGDADEEQEYILAPMGRITAPLVVTAAAAAFGSSFPHGWNTGVLNAPSSLIISFINSTYTNRYGSSPSAGLLNILWAMTVSIYLVGGCAGAFSAGWLADAMGRKKALLFTHIFSFIAAALFGFCKMADSFEMLIIARLVVGYACGAGSGLVPMYLTEIAPVNIRGAMGVLHQFALTCGILFSQIFGLKEIMGNESLWPVLLAMTCVPCIVSLLVLPWVPDSPRYLLVNKGDEQAAENALKRFRGTDDVYYDVDEMKMEQAQLQKEPKWSVLQLLRTSRLRTPLVLVCSLAMCQQLSGINVVFYYSGSVFLSSGIPTDSIQYAVLATGLINCIMTGISVPLMEKSGRRALLLGGMAVMIFFAAVITIALNLQKNLPWMAYISIICIIGFVIGFSIGLGSIPQFIGAELFKQGPRPPAMSLAGLLNWACNVLVGISFPSLQSALQAYSFVVFIGFLIFFWAFLWWKLPETKNKTFQEIYQIFDIDEAEDVKQADNEETEKLMAKKKKEQEASKTLEMTKVPNGSRPKADHNGNHSGSVDLINSAENGALRHSATIA